MDVASATAAASYRRDHNDRVPTVAAVTPLLLRRAARAPPHFVGERSDATTPSAYPRAAIRSDRTDESVRGDEDAPRAVAADGDARDVATGETTSTNDNDCVERDQEASTRDTSTPVRRPSRPTTQDQVTAEIFMRIVLAHQPYASAAHERTAAWHAIAGACAAAGSRGISRAEHVTKCLGILTTSLFESPHRLTSELRGMVLVFNERNCSAGYGTRLGGAFLSTLRRHAKSGVAVNNHTDRQVDTPFGPARRRNRVLTLRAQEDARLMQIVMTIRPFDASKTRKMAAWNHVAVAFNTSLHDMEAVRGNVGSAKSAVGRVAAVSSAVLSRADPYNAHLSPSLRATIVEFNLLNRVPEGRSRALPTPQASQAWATRRPRLASDELFMRIVMEKRSSIHARSGATVQMWDQVADAFVAAGGDQMHGYSAMTRMWRRS